MLAVLQLPCGWVDFFCSADAWLGMILMQKGAGLKCCFCMKWLMPLLMWEPYAAAVAVRLEWWWKAPDFLSPACCSGFCVRLLAALAEDGADGLGAGALCKMPCHANSDSAGLISPCEPLEINRPCSSAVDSDESMPPKESGHDSVQALSSVYPDYDALDSSAVSRAFMASFQLESRCKISMGFLLNADHEFWLLVIVLWVVLMPNVMIISVELKTLPCCSRFWLCCLLIYLQLNAYAAVVMGSIAEMDGFWVGLDGPLSADIV
ncbi:hypothetical protein Nepgr_022800 [Nepenthes gracilis]|uniref:Uncharacterized protein n=1 Tax=Nepenthes gracilis TaxID=150966 RepID=A0AAD3SZR6_NEPGR|nr:hypothetical protein Nepgr_022800 [Nepenthes gracilis]